VSLAGTTQSPTQWLLLRRTVCSREACTMCGPFLTRMPRCVATLILVAFSCVNHGCARWFFCQATQRP
jgi:hypothetical protein